MTNPKIWVCHIHLSDIISVKRRLTHFMWSQNPSKPNKARATFFTFRFQDVVRRVMIIWPGGGSTAIDNIFDRVIGLIGRRYGD